MGFMLVTEYCLIMKVLEEVKLLLLENNKGPSRIDAGLDKCIYLEI